MSRNNLMRSSLFRRLASLIVFAAVAGCGDSPAPTESESNLLVGTGTRLIACPNDVAQTATVVADPLLGGVVTLPGVSLQIPPGAVTVPTLLFVTVPESRFAEVRITALGIEHLLFDQDVTVTIDYSRCARPSLDRTPLVAWYVDTRTKLLLERMGGVDDKATHRVTFKTGHLSSYALAE
jgi:hypothetical protein